jgi:hypothetical protein
MKAYTIESFRPSKRYSEYTVVYTSVCKKIYIHNLQIASLISDKRNKELLIPPVPFYCIADERYISHKDDKPSLVSLSVCNRADYLKDALVREHRFDSTILEQNEKFISEITTLDDKIFVQNRAKMDEIKFDLERQVNTLRILSDKQAIIIEKLNNKLDLKMKLTDLRNSLAEQTLK